MSEIKTKQGDIMWLEIFKSGTHTDSAGKTETYTPETIDTIVNVYNERISESSDSEAPVVKGHPQSNAPAYGWIERLARRGDKLYAKLKNLAPEFIDEVRRGSYRKVSIALYPDLMLRHVGFLGAVPPAVKGLKGASFSDEFCFTEFESVQISFVNSKKGDTGDLPDEETAMDISMSFCDVCCNSTDDSKDVASKSMDKECFGKDVACDVRDVACNVSTCELANKAVELKKIVTEFEQLNNELNARIETYKAQIENTQKEARTKEYREFVNSLLERKEGSPIKPAQTQTLIDLLEIAHFYDSQCRNEKEFAESDSNVEKIKSLFNKMQPQFSTKEFAVKRTSEATLQSVQFDDKNVPPQRLALHRKAIELLATSPTLTYEEAVNQVAVEIG
ncbi:MAG: hypothetical protein HW421_3783 [Ignavibacteria bacterium]|nr:hypothetical protein [Ignavibacteria bacterium]